MTLCMGQVLSDTDPYEPQDTCVDPRPYTESSDWVTAFEYRGAS